MIDFLLRSWLWPLVLPVLAFRVIARFVAGHRTGSASRGQDPPRAAGTDHRAPAAGPGEIPAPRGSRVWPLVLPALGVLTLALYVADLGGDVRVLVTFAFLVFGPGWALIRFLHLTDPAAIVTLVLAVSLAVDTTIGLTLAYSGHWSPGAGLVAVLVLVLLASALQMAPRRKRTDGAP